MISGVAWPRLPRARAMELQLALIATPLERAREEARLMHPYASLDEAYGAVSDERVARVQAELRAVADDRGWPESLADVDTAALDRAWGGVLYEGMDIVPVDASREGVWSFLALVVVPDLAAWRFPRMSQRFVGVGDHVFGRLWWRHFVLGPQLMSGDELGSLTESELVALFRRGDLVANPHVARAIVRAVLQSNLIGAERLALVKRLVLDLLHLTPGILLDALDDAALDDMLRRLLGSRFATPPPR